MIYAISPPSLNALGCLDQILWKGTDPPSVLQEDKKPQQCLKGKTQTQIIKSLAVQRLKDIELEKQCIHHVNVFKYLVPSSELT